MDRQPVVAGRFYDASPDKLGTMVNAFLAQSAERKTEKTLLAMVPHAGYVFSGAVCGKTLGLANLEPTILLLGPNHTGKGERFALWPDGNWNIPGWSMPVDTELADILLEANVNIIADTTAHMDEHSLEVILPFLRSLNPETTIVPISISAHSFDALEQVGKSIGKALKTFGRPVSIVVSSYMSHYIPHDAAEKKDSLALEPAVNLRSEERRVGKEGLL